MTNSNTHTCIYFIYTIMILLMYSSTCVLHMTSIQPPPCCACLDLRSASAKTLGQQSKRAPRLATGKSAAISLTRYLGSSSHCAARAPSVQTPAPPEPARSRARSARSACEKKASVRRIRRR